MRTGEKKMIGKEFPAHEKFPPRTWCKYPYRKCKDCCHEEPCVPDYDDLYRKIMWEDELTFGDVLFCIVFWALAIGLITYFIL